MAFTEYPQIFHCSWITICKSLVVAVLIFTSLNSELWTAHIHGFIFFYKCNNAGLETDFDKLQLVTDLIKTSIAQSCSKGGKPIYLLQCH